MLGGSISEGSEVGSYTQIGLTQNYGHQLLQQ
jgi:hypothetical protein